MVRLVLEIWRYIKRNPGRPVVLAQGCPSTETDLQICSLSGKFDLWSYPPMDHKETTHLVTQTYFLSIPTFLVSFEDACAKKIIFI